jgi:hypothetical protein
MIVVVLVALGIVGLPLALGLAWVLHALRLLPAGVTPPVAAPLLTVTALTALLIAVDMDSLVIEPVALQRKLLGSTYAYPWDLREYGEWGFQDPGQSWAYRLPPPKRALLMARCKTEASRPDFCWLGAQADDSGGTSIRVREGKMEIMDWAS